MSGQSSQSHKGPQAIHIGKDNHIKKNQPYIRPPTGHSKFAVPHFRRPRIPESSWLSWLMQNKIVLIIILILFVVIVVPWLLCDVLGLNFICTIISGIFKFFSKIFSLIGL